MNAFMKRKEEELRDLIEYTKQDYVLFPEFMRMKVISFVYDLTEEEYDLCDSIAEFIVTKLPSKFEGNLFDWYVPGEKERKFLVHVENEGLMKPFQMYISILINYKYHLRDIDPNKMA